MIMAGKAYCHSCKNKSHRKIVNYSLTIFRRWHVKRTMMSLFICFFCLLNTYAQNVLVGAESTAEYFPLLKNKRIGIFTNHTGRIGEKHLVDSLHQSGFNIVTIFAPEHGFRGNADAGEKINNDIDAETGIPIYSLYKSKTGKPSNHEIQKFDERNNMIYKSFYDKNDSLVWEYFAHYDSQDSLYYEEAKDKNGITTHRSDLKYNKYHSRISLKLYSNKNGEIREMYSRYKYDKQQRLLLEEIFLPREKRPFLMKKYFYDTHNNWIFCIEEDKRTGNTIVNSQRIEYY